MIFNAATQKESKVRSGKDAPYSCFVEPTRNWFFYGLGSLVLSCKTRQSFLETDYDRRSFMIFKIKTP